MEVYKKYVKRGLDILISIGILPLVIFIILIFGGLIYFEDKGSIFYNAERIGRYGKAFKMYKLRTMKVDSEDIRLEDGSTYNAEDDPRVTRIGKLLRKTSLDEFPQFINVLKGEMSIIGPRPDPTDWIDKYPTEIKPFLEMRPGITGYSQAYFRNSVDGYEKMKNDLFYAENVSFKLDLKIFIKTIASVIKSENMYKE